MVPDPRQGERRGDRASSGQDGPRPPSGRERRGDKAWNGQDGPLAPSGREAGRPGLVCAFQQGGRRATGSGGSFSRLSCEFRHCRRGHRCPPAKPRVGERRPSGRWKKGGRTHQEPRLQPPATERLSDVTGEHSSCEEASLTPSHKAGRPQSVCSSCPSRSTPLLTPRNQGGSWPPPLQSRSLGDIGWTF